MRLLKTIHGWLGVLVLPWVMIIGLTGLYLNHETLVTGWLEARAYDEAQFDAWPGARSVSEEEAAALALRLFPGAVPANDAEAAYHGRRAVTFEDGETQVIVALETGHYWLKTDLRRVTHAPDGTILETKVYWGQIFKRLHERGWLSRSFGTWLADITAAAMVIFGLTGIVLFMLPRIRRRQNRHRMRAG